MNHTLEAVGKNQVWVGESASIQWVKTQLKEAAETDMPVLVAGEAGTGRRMAVRTLHALSPRREHALVWVDCSGLHEAQVMGMFSGEGGDEKIKGTFALARQGTLCLEAVEALPWAAQERLVRILREQKLHRRDGAHLADIRIVAITDRDLGRLVREGKCVEELYYRLNLVSVKLPPLRERRKDIPLLVVHFIGQAAARMGGIAPHCSQRAMQLLMDHLWPGNVWELKRLLERLLVLDGSAEISPERVRGLLQRAGSAWLEAGVRGAGKR